MSHPESINPRTPLPVSLAQWPEARSSRRTYTGDPDRQARVAMFLIGFKHELQLYNRAATDVCEAIDVVLKGFYEEHPEFLVDGFERDTETEMGSGIYHPDERLVHYMGQILGSGSSETS
jgi:hypothetical protein